MKYIVDATVQEIESIELDVQSVTEITAEFVTNELDLASEGKTLVDFEIRNG